MLPSSFLIYLLEALVVAYWGLGGSFVRFSAMQSMLCMFMLIRGAIFETAAVLRCDFRRLDRCVELFRETKYCMLNITGITLEVICCGLLVHAL